MKANRLMDEWIDNALSYPREDLRDLHGYLARLIDYCVDDAPNGYGFDKALSERQKMTIIYNILDVLKTWVFNLSEHKVIYNNKIFLKNIEKTKGHRIYMAEKGVLNGKKE